MEGTSDDIPCSSMDIPFEDTSETDEEPSPLVRILVEGRSFNGGNWKSNELKLFFDGVQKYGTTSKAINFIHKTLVKTRSVEEIRAKLDEIRDIIKEHKDVILPEFNRERWLAAGHRNIGIPSGYDVDPNDDWSNIISQVVNHHHTALNKTCNPARDTFEKVFEKFSKDCAVQENVKVTKMQTARATPSDTQQIRWPLIYQFMKACSVMDEQMPPLNELEAAVLLKVLDTIEDEAAMIPDSEKAILAGLFKECQLKDFRSCEQDYPPNEQAAVQLFVDPLRTRTHGIPEVAAEVDLFCEEGDNPQTSAN